MKHARSDYDARIQDGAGLIPDDEPVLLIRGQDVCATAALDGWVAEAIAQGVDADLVDLILTHRDTMEAWQAAHGAKVPDAPKAVLEPQPPLDPQAQSQVMVAAFAHVDLVVRRGLAALSADGNPKLDILASAAREVPVPTRAMAMIAGSMLAVMCSLVSQQIGEQPTTVWDGIAGMVDIVAAADGPVDPGTAATEAVDRAYEAEAERDAAG